MESRMQGNLHVRFGEGDGETCSGNGARRFIPTLPRETPPNATSPRCWRMDAPHINRPRRCDTAMTFDESRAPHGGGLASAILLSSIHPVDHRAIDDKTDGAKFAAIKTPDEAARRHFFRLQRARQSVAIALVNGSVGPDRGK